MNYGTQDIPIGGPATGSNAPGNSYGSPHVDGWPLSDSSAPTTSTKSSSDALKIAAGVGAGALAGGALAGRKSKDTLGRKSGEKLRGNPDVVSKMAGRPSDDLAPPRDSGAHLRGDEVCLLLWNT